MKPTVHNIEQGSQEWLDLRKGFFTASEANAMMGMCKHKTRTQLLHEKFTGEKPVVSNYTQRIFDNGHAVEELARPIIEDAFDDELYPLVMTRSDLLASLDGVNFDYTMAWEHKQWNESLAQSVKNGVIPESHIYQLEQQLYVSQAEKLLFTVSNGTEEKLVSTWYYSTPERQAKLLKGWEQFKYDLSQYTPASDTPKGTSIDNLMALDIRVTGSVLASNLDVFRENAISVIDSINTELKSDQDFADAELAIKWCKSTEKALANASEDIITQSSDIKTITQTLSELSEQVRWKRLIMEKAVKNQKDLRKRDLIEKAESELRNYISSLNFSNPINFYRDFKKSIFGCKTLSSVQNSIASELIQAKNDLDQMKQDELLRIEKTKENMILIQNLSKGYESIFHDAGYLAATLTLEELTRTIQDRISGHKKQIEAAIEAAAAIKAKADEIKAKADADADAAKAKADATKAAKAKADADAAKAKADATKAAKAKAAKAKACEVKAVEQVEILTDFTHTDSDTLTPPDSDDLLSLSQIGDILQIQVSSVLLQSLGIKSNSFMYSKHDLPNITAALINHLKNLKF